MRKILWTGLISLTLGSLMLSVGVPWIPRPQHESADSSPAGTAPVPEFASETSRPGSIEIAEAGVEARRDPQIERNVDEAEELGIDSPDRILEWASDREIRRVLEEAIAVAQRTRTLRIHPSVVETVVQDGRVRVVFEIHPASSPEALASRLAGPHGAPEDNEVRLFPLLSHGAAHLGPDALLTLIESGATPSIELDRVHRPSLLDSLPIIGADLAHALESDGDGTFIAVLDTGVEGTHPLFASRLAEEACFSALGQCPNASTQMFGPGSAAPCSEAQCDHGTHVAGVALARDAGGPLVGVAPNAGLIAIQIFSEFDGSIGAYSSDILAALQHVLGLSAFYNIAAVNMSIAGDPFTSAAVCDSTVASQRAAVALLRDAGIATVAAAGNDGLTNAVTTPGCLSNVIGVGSTTDADVVSSFTNSASFLSVFAPGESVESAAFGGTTRYASGTSIATPHVAGAIAAIREAHPASTVGEIENAIALSGFPVLDSRNGETVPRIDVQATIDLLTASVSPPPSPSDPPAGEGEGGSASAAANGGGAGGGGGGSSCGLVGIEPFLVLGLIRIGRRRRRAASTQAIH